MAISVEDQKEVLTTERFEYSRPDLFVSFQPVPLAIFQREIDMQETKEALIQLIKQRREAALKARNL